MVLGRHWSLIALAFFVIISSKILSSRAMASRGVFILFEGIDRCGKTTQANMLTKYLGGLVKTPNQGNNVEFIRFPDRTSTIGQMINSYLVSATNMNDNTIHLLFSANRWEASQDIEKKLNSGCNLVCDRYAYSGVAFTSAKGLDLDWCKACDIGLPAPDCVIYLDMPVEEAAGRGQYGEERYEKVDFQLKVREKFMQLKNADEGVLPWYTLDARRSIDELHEEIKMIAHKAVEENQNKALSKLWMK
jgi:dTMP kinase